MERQMTRDPLDETETSKTYYKDHSWLFDDDLSIYEGTKPRIKSFSEEFLQVPIKSTKKPLGIPKGLKVDKRKYLNS
jgi:hypothetical protein